MAYCFVRLLVQVQLQKIEIGINVFLRWFWLQCCQSWYSCRLVTYRFRDCRWGAFCERLMQGSRWLYLCHSRLEIRPEKPVFRDRCITFSVSNEFLEQYFVSLFSITKAWIIVCRHGTSLSTSDATSLVSSLYHICCVQYHWRPHQMLEFHAY